MNFQSILIITYGRSGSTLLQGILNSIEGVTIHGENDNFLYSLFLAYKSLITAQSGHASETEPTDPWYGAGRLNPQLFLQKCRDIVTDQLKAPNDKVFGFKEIKYHGIGPSNIGPYLAFLREIFPNPIFVFNTRDLDKVCNSAWWQKYNKDLLKKALIKTENAFKAYSDAHPEYCHMQTHEDTTGDKIMLKNLFRKININYDESSILKILNIPHSYVYKTRSKLKFGYILMIDSQEILFDLRRNCLEDGILKLSGILYSSNLELTPTVSIIGKSNAKIIRQKFNLSSKLFHEKNKLLPNSENVRFEIEVELNNSKIPSLLLSSGTNSLLKIFVENE